MRLLTFGLFQIDFDQRMTQLNRTLKRKVSLICSQLVFGCSTDQYKTGVWHLQTADCRLQTTDRRLHEAARLLIEWNQKYRNKDDVIINITLFGEVRPTSEVYIFHPNYTYPIPKGAVGCSFRIELEQKNVCRCHKLAHESIARVLQFSLHHRRN